MEDVRLELISIYRKYLNKEPNNFHINTLEDIVKKFTDGKKRLTIMAPVGTGKSTMILALAKYLSKNIEKEILILTYNKVLRLQFESLIEEINSKDRSQNVIITNNIKVITVHELLNNQTGENFSKRFEYILADEFQDYDVKKCRAVFETLGGKTLTVSSLYNQIYRYDGVIPVITLSEMLSINKPEIQHSHLEELASVKDQIEYFRYHIQREKDEKEALKNELKKIGDIYEKQKSDLIAQHNKEKEKLENDLKMYQSMVNSLTYSITEINSTMKSMHGSVKELGHEMLEMKNEINNGMDRLNQEVKNICREIKTVISALGQLQDEVSKKLENQSEEEREKIYHSFSDELMKSIVSTIESKNDARYNIEKDNLIAIFGPNNWSKLSPKSSQYLITSRIVLNNMLSYEHQIDYSPACIPITKALENELFIHLFYNFKIFCKAKRIPYREWPDGLTHYNGNNNTYLELFDDKFTLGSTAFIIGGKTDSYRPRRAVTGRSVFLRYCKEALFRNDLGLDDSAINQYLNNFESDIETITRKYRNQAAHRDGIKLNVAEDCYNYIIAVTKVLVNFIEKLN